MSNLSNVVVSEWWWCQSGGATVWFMVPGDYSRGSGPAGFLRSEPGNGHITYAIVILAGSKENLQVQGEREHK